ncbi:MAG TPA: GNAT family protein [Rhodothermales bacterium]|nr:GNAT family protein [Rhodothermales bacterium]
MSRRLPFLEGKMVILRPLMEDDVSGAYLEWLNDAETCAGNSHHVFPYTEEAALEYVRNTRRSRSELALAIELKDSSQHVGNVTLQGIHPVYRSAEYAILIGDPAARGQGIAFEASSLLLAHGFRELHLHRIYCGTFHTNTAMARLAARLGMREEGRRREAVFKGGQWLDVVEFGVLSKEFEQLHAHGV